jgi:hypothetical protein
MKGIGLIGLLLAGLVGCGHPPLEGQVVVRVTSEDRCLDNDFGQYCILNGADLVPDTVGRTLIIEGTGTMADGPHLVTQVMGTYASGPVDAVKLDPPVVGGYRFTGEEVVYFE